MDLKELESGVDPKVHWYYQTKKIPLFRYFEHLLAQQERTITIIDFGSGSGFFAYELFEKYPQHIEQVLLVDIGYTDQELAETKGAKVRKVHRIPKGIEYSLLIMMDVLEHIEDDYAILQDIKSCLDGEAYYFVTVPAFQSVWSSHDVYLGHYRRYTIPMLRHLLVESGFKIKTNYYIFTAIFPVVWLLRRWKRNKGDMEEPKASDMSPAPAPVNTLLRGYHGLEMKFRKWNRWFGLTCVAEGKLTTQ